MPQYAVNKKILGHAWAHLCPFDDDDNDDDDDDDDDDNDDDGDDDDDDDCDVYMYKLPINRTAAVTGR